MKHDYTNKNWEEEANSTSNKPVKLGRWLIAAIIIVILIVSLYRHLPWSKTGKHVAHDQDKSPQYYTIDLDLQQNKGKAS